MVQKADTWQCTPTKRVLREKSVNVLFPSYKTGAAALQMQLYIVTVALPQNIKGTLVEVPVVKITAT